MSICIKHETHSYRHDLGGAQVAITHAGHTDYLHTGRVRHTHADHVDEHVLEIRASNPDRCTPDHACGAHDNNHTHGLKCSNEPVPHGDHVDYLLWDDLPHPHEDPCDDHGPVILAPRRHCVPRGAMGFWCAGSG